MKLLAGALVLLAAVGPAVAAPPEAGQLEVAATVFTSSYPDAAGGEALGNWVGLRPRVGYAIDERWHVGAEAVVAVERAYTSQELMDPFTMMAYREPIPAFGGAFVEGTWSPGPRAGVRLVIGKAIPGAFGRGPLAEPRFRNLEQPGGREDDGLNWAFGLTVPLRLPVHERVTIVSAPGVNVHYRATISEEAFATYDSAQLPIGAELAFAPWLSAGGNAGLWLASGEKLIPVWATVNVVLGGAVELGVQAGVQYRKRQYALEWEDSLYVGVTLGGRLALR